MIRDLIKRKQYWLLPTATLLWLFSPFIRGGKMRSPNPLIEVLIQVGIMIGVLVCVTLFMLQIIDETYENVKSDIGRCEQNLTPNITDMPCEELLKIDWNNLTVLN